MAKTPPHVSRLMRGLAVRQASCEEKEAIDKVVSRLQPIRSSMAKAAVVSSGHSDVPMLELPRLSIAQWFQTCAPSSPFIARALLCGLYKPHKWARASLSLDSK